MLQLCLFPNSSTDGDAENALAPLPILIASADPMLSRALAELFTVGGYAVTCAGDGIDALDHLRRQAFPLVVADIDLPRLNGLELVRELADFEPATECLLLADKDALESVLEAVDCGNVYNYFWKPLTDLGEIARGAARAWERRELRLSRAHLLSELRDCKQERKALDTRLEQLDKVAALGQMTECIARDLETPLKSLLSYAQYLQARLSRDDADRLTPEQIARIREFLCDMEEGVSRCQSVAAGTLDYTRVHAEPPSPVNLHAVIEQTLTLLWRTLDAQGIDLHLNLASPAPLVSANPRRLQQALTNVLLNAQQAVGTSGGSITLATAYADEDDPDAGIRISISDTGSGIAPGVLPYVFDPFFTTRKTCEQLGLGLTIARRIMEDAHGSLNITSKAGKGTTLTLNLPLCTQSVVPVSERCAA
jgi:signal transduction histidine kinase